jgi:ATP-dependent DNA helicase RecQ
VSPREILKKYWGYDSFRPPQDQIIEEVLKHRDVLALLPTGGGKSVCFQVPALIMDGVCVVITPLIALMQDQVAQLKKREINAVAIHSGLGRREIDILLDNCVYGSVKFLYVSPERIQTEIFQERFKKMNVQLVAIDEAHCISQWGHDFRPPYLQIKLLRELKPDVAFIALTASATAKVKEDITTQLVLKRPANFQISFARSNISFVVRKTESKEKKLLEILRRVPGSAIIYLRSRKGTTELARYLERQKIPATFYHAGLEHSEREKRQEAWIQNRVRVMVATNAFGMGIDKPDVRVVVHMDLAQDPESYYQEAGRAGRDGQRSYAAIVYHESDVMNLRKKVEESVPTVKQLRDVYQALANHYQLAVGGSEGESFDFDLEDFSGKFGMRSTQVFVALKKLQDEALIEMSESFYQPSRLHFLVDNKNLYGFEIANAYFEPLIKAVLRLYGASLFTDFVSISEKQIAQFMNVAPGAVTPMLVRLKEMQVVGYEPASDNPRITFLTPRQDASRLSINVPRLEERRKLNLSKMEAMTNYVVQSKRCRMQLLQEYFDEQDTKPCGTCDVCIEGKKEKDTSVLKDYRTQVIFLLGQQPLPVDSLETSVDPKDKELFIEVVREMLDEGLIAYDEKWVLQLVKKKK